ncbi:MAG: DUF4349 domain-containing protein [Deltaproteobacteria bacterium]|nr:DUF4349 domain-containing protein [Deltaproteobacteria bacterium]MBW2530593.1 DUF4349 domain-containing protein [Deltaproteobacteria bacterium]
MHRYVRPIATILCACALAAAGCAKDEATRSADAPAAAKAPAADVAERGLDTATAAGEQDPKRALPAERKLIQNAELELKVASYADARRAIDRQVAEVKGYLANAEVDHHDGRVSRATLVLRIPADQLASFLDSSASVGTVVREGLETQDITDQYYDLDARLRSAKKLEERLIELVGSHQGGVKDLLEVERELARVRERIESMEGKLRLFDKQVAFSTLRLVLITEQVYAGGPPAGLGDRAWSVLTASWSALVSFGRALVLMAAGLLPWLPLILGAAWLARRGLRRLSRSMRSRQPQTAPPAAPWPQGA